MISSDPVAELPRIGGHRVEDELLDACVDARLERRDDLVGRPEQVDRLEVVRPALAAHHLQERPMLLLAGLGRVVRQHEMQEVLVRDRELAGVLAVLPE